MRKSYFVSLMAILLALFTCATAFSQKPSKAQPPKRHAFLKIPAEFITEHVAAHGTRVILEFREQSNVVVLEFIGFDSLGNITKREILPVTSQQPRLLRNAYYGQFRNNEANLSIHQIITTTPIRDWFLKPQRYKDDENARYVAYDLSNQAFNGPEFVPSAASRLNPSPPCCL